MKKYCVKCGKPFDAAGREVICPSCKAAAAEETKRAAVMRAKRASWTGESVPVRISGRASTVIREYGAANNLPFAAALDALLQASDYFVSSGKAWDEVEPYRSHRRDKATSASPDVLLAACRQLLAPQDVKQEVKQDAQEVPQDVKQDVKQAAKQASKASASKVAAKATSKASASKASKASASDSKAGKAGKAGKAVFVKEAE